MKRVYSNEDYFYLKRVLDGLNEKQSSDDPIPILFPDINRTLENTEYKII